MTRRPTITEEPLTPGKVARASRAFIRAVRSLHITEEPVQQPAPAAGVA